MCTQAPSTQRDQPLQRSRMGLLVTGGIGDGRGTGNDEPIRDLGVTLHVHDAARALLSALRLPSGIFNVCTMASVSPATISPRPPMPPRTLNGPARWRGHSSVQAMQLGIAAQAAAVLEQSRIVGRDALEECLDRALNLGVTGGRVTKQRAVVDQ